MLEGQGVRVCGNPSMLKVREVQGTEGRIVAMRTPALLIYPTPVAAATRQALPQA